MNIQALCLTFLAGISTILGYFVIGKKWQDQMIPCSLGFSVGVMLFVSFFDLLPTSLGYFKSTYIAGFHILFCLLFFFLGVLLSVFMKEGIHSHSSYDSLYQIGFLSMLALMLHNIPEGIITYLTTTIEYRTGLLLTISIACHNIPEGICIAVPIYYSTKSKKQAFKMVLLSALSEPIGALFAAFFLKDKITGQFLGMLLAMVAGIMTSLVFFDILPESLSYSKKHTILFLFLGILTILISHLLF